MTEPASVLMNAFREDHAKLGTEFHELSTCLRGGDLDGAKRAARVLDRDAGAHIAFEEEVFYPRIAALLDRDEAARLLAEHSEGFEVVARLCVEQGKTPLSRETQQQLLAQSERMESHIAECGEMFEAIGRIPAPEQRALYDALITWRKRAPSWRSYLAERVNGRSTSEAPG